MQQIYALHLPKSMTGCSLVAVYNTHADEQHKGTIIRDKDIMNCLWITLEGSGTIVLDDKTSVILKEKDFILEKASNITFIKSNCAHWHFLCYWFNPISLNIPSGVRHLEDLDVAAEDALCTQIIELMQTGLKNKQEYSNALFTCRLLELREYLPQKMRRSEQLFNDIVAYINVNLAHLPSVKEIAKYFAYSEKHLRTIFERYAKLTPKQYIIKRKLEQIAILLDTSPHSIQTLAELFDFYSPSHLISCFKKEYGVSPNVYRLHNRP